MKLGKVITLKMSKFKFAMEMKIAAMRSYFLFNMLILIIPSRVVFF